MRKILFFGSDHFSIKSFKEIYKELFQEHKIFATCIQGGRFEKFIKHNSEIDNFKNDLEFNETFDVGIVASFGKFIPRKVISKFGYMINIHPSLLPNWRGPAPIQRSLMNQSGIGVSIIGVHPKTIDAGDIYRQMPIQDGRIKFFSDFSNEAAILGAQLVNNIIKENSFDKRKAGQDHSKATYAAAIRNEDAIIDCKTMSADQIYDIFRAISHQETLHMNVNDGKIIYLRKVIQEERLEHKPLQLGPGQICYEKNERNLWLGCSKGSKIGIKEGLIKGKSTILDAGGLYSALHLRNFDMI
jgi:methionyl-tRNA formyltransferase